MMPTYPQVSLLGEHIEIVDSHLYLGLQFANNLHLHDLPIKDRQEIKLNDTSKNERS